MNQIYFFLIITAKKLGYIPFRFNFYKNKRIPGITLSEYFSILKILFVGNSTTVNNLTKSRKLKKLFWEL